MTLKEFASLLDGREYGCEITLEEEKLAKELGFVVVFGYSDDNAELRGAINDEIGCYDGGELTHVDLPATIYADWCPEDIDCAWAYGTSITHEKFYIYDHGELYCVGIVCDISKPKQTNAERIRAMSVEELAEIIMCPYGSEPDLCCTKGTCLDCCMKWLNEPAEVTDGQSNDQK